MFTTSLGLVDKDLVVETRKNWDVDGNGFLNMAQFCEMMCPSGVRATAESLVATGRDGRQIMFDRDKQTWSLAGRYGDMVTVRRS